jgi:hypothetical protein
MPNWCNNTLEISHEDPAMMERVRKAFTDGRLLDEFIPVPKSLHIVAGRVGDDTDPKQIELEAQEKANLEAHGYSTWYDFCVNEWGTKWDIGGDGMEPHDDGPNRTTLAFDSAWAPPTAAMDKLMDMGFSVRLYYYEPGMCFAGIYDENGDDYYDLGDMTSDQVAEELPSELDEMFGISETMAEYEAEEAEEEENEENK